MDSTGFLLAVRSFLLALYPVAPSFRTHTIQRQESGLVDANGPHVTVEVLHESLVGLLEFKRHAVSPCPETEISRDKLRPDMHSIDCYMIAREFSAGAETG